MNQNDKFHQDAQSFEINDDMLNSISGGYSLEELPESIFCPYCNVNVPKAEYINHMACLQRYLSENNL